LKLKKDRKERRRSVFALLFQKDSPLNRVEHAADVPGDALAELRSKKTQLSDLIL
jgi:hypothetical protein